MAPKKASLAPKDLGTIRKKLEEVSLAEDSAWRDADPEEVLMLEESIIANANYGVTAMANASIVYENGMVKVSATDGKDLIDDGRKIVTVLLNIGKRLATMLEEEKESALWYNDALKDVFENGYLFSRKEYPLGTENLERVIYQTLRHEEDQNRFEKTSLLQKATVARKMYEREGSCWTTCRKALLALLGDAKSSTINRWITIARDFNPSFLRLTKQKDVPQNWICGNKFFVGIGEESRFKLGAEWGEIAFKWLLDSLDSRVPLNADCVRDEYCLVAKHCETWARSQEKRFKSIATGFKAYDRCIQRLGQESGRKAVLAYLRSKAAPGDKKPPHFGIEELKIVVEEMEKIKAGTLASQGQDAGKPSSQTESQEGADSQMHDDPMGTNSADNEHKDEDACMGDYLGEGSRATTEPLLDPVLEAAKDLALKELVKIVVYQDRDEWCKDVAASVFASHAAIVIIDCPSSKLSVLSNFLKLAPSLPKKCAIFVPVGTRLEMLMNGKAILEKNLPGRVFYVIQFHAGLQSTRKRPVFGLYAPVEGEEGIPANVDLSGCGAKAAEGIRQRCINRNCPLRPSGSEPGSAAPSNDNEEIPGDDLMDEQLEAFCEDAGGDEAGSDGNDATEGDNLDTDALADVDERNRYLVNLYPCANPIKMNMAILKTLLRAGQRTHLLYLSRTAHPSYIIAAREFGLKVIALVEGANEHSQRHGDALLRSLLTHRKLKEASLALPAGQKRSRPADDQNYITIDAPADQIIRLKDVAPTEASKWRGGLNKSPQELSEKITRLLQWEQASFHMDLQYKDKQVSVVTRKAFREGDVLGNATGLVFDSIDALRIFFSEDGRKSLADKVVRINGIKLTQESESASSVYVVLTGFVRHVGHYTKFGRKAPNCHLRVNTTAGVNDGLLQLVVRTPNHCGIGLGGLVLMDYGLTYNHDLKISLDEPDAKKFRGILDSYFSSLTVAKVASATIEQASVKEKSTNDDAAADANEEKEAKKKKEEEEKKETVKKQEEEAKPNEPPKADEEAQKKPVEGEIALLQEPFPLRLIFEMPTQDFAGELRLAAVETLDGNKKLPPRLVLYTTEKGDGEINKKIDGGVRFGWTHTKTTYVAEKGSACAVTLFSFIEKAKPKTIAKHDGYTGGKIPQTLKPTTEMSFVVSAGKEKVKALLDFVAKLAEVDIIFRVSVSKASDLLPTQVALCLKKQIIIPSSGVYVLK